MKLPIYNLEGKKTGKTISLAPEIFGLEPNPVLVQQAVEAQRSGSRKVIAHTKTRSERRGGGAKPWRQKGTGRARAGSRRSPLWRKGGVTFGPRQNRNFVKRINRKARRRAVVVVLSDRAQSGDIVALESLKGTTGKTKGMVSLLAKLPLKAKVLILLSCQDEMIRRAARNLSKIKVLGAQSLNVIDLLNCDSILMPVKAVKIIEKIYPKEAKSLKRKTENCNPKRKTI